MFLEEFFFDRVFNKVVVSNILLRFDWFFFLGGVGVVVGVGSGSIWGCIWGIIMGWICIGVGCDVIGGIIVIIGCGFGGGVIIIGWLFGFLGGFIGLVRLMWRLILCVWGEGGGGGGEVVGILVLMEKFDFWVLLE